MSILEKPLDVSAIRAQFPALQRHVHGKPLVYLDNAASAQKPLAVLDAMRDAYANHYANVHRGLHTLANEATEAFEGARITVQRFLNAARPEEIVFTKNATEAINLVAASFASPLIGEGDEIVLTVMEHHSNIVPWHFLRERQGAKLRWVPVGDDGSFDIAAFEAALSPATRMVAITHMSNVLGTVVPVAEVVALAHARGIPVLVDGSQAAVHLPVDVQAIGADFYVFTGHKVYGPSGIGVLYGKHAHLMQMRPFLGGGEMIASAGEDAITYADPPYRFEAGTPMIGEAPALAAAINWMEAIGKPAIMAHERMLRDAAAERLSRVPGLRLLGSAPEKGAIHAFTLGKAHAHDIATIVDRYGVAIRAGAHCAEPLMARFGLTSTCRASFAIYNTTEEVEALGTALDKAATMLG